MSSMSRILRYVSDIIALEMSGHSKWSTIKRQKAVNDNARGKVFSRLSRAITMAAKVGGDIEMNYKLRVAVEAARMENMPKETIERAIHKAQETGVLEEISYEGFGPGGVGVVVQVATDNRNRTAQEIKSIFERAGGSLGGPGSVLFNFEPKGYLLIEKKEDPDSQMLTLIDLGIEDLEVAEDGVEAYTDSHELFAMKGKIEVAGFTVLWAELILKSKTQIPVDQKGQERLLDLISTLEVQDDVQKVFDNAQV